MVDNNFVFFYRINYRHGLGAIKNTKTKKACSEWVARDKTDK